ncbi:MAG: hypothetical protein ACH253_17020 [Candidatus Thiodiazotropha sp.]
MSGLEKPRLRASAAFQGVSGAKLPKKRPSPFCIRLSIDERAYLE